MNAPDGSLAKRRSTALDSLMRAPLDVVIIGGGSPAGVGWRCRVEDRLSGLSHVMEAGAVVNATGPWAQGLARSR